MFCKDCSKRPTCKEICQELKKILPKPNSGKLRGEHSFDPYILELVASKRAIELRYGKRKKTYYEE